MSKVHFTVGGEVRCGMWSLCGILARSTDRARVTCALCLRALERDDKYKAALRELSR